MKLDTKKNILDLHFQKHLAIASTSVIIGFTYLIGLVIALLTRQINFRDLASWIILIVVSVLFMAFISILFFHSKYHLQNIIETLKGIDSEK